MDLQITDAAYNFCQRLKAHDLFFRKSQVDGIEDQKYAQSAELLANPETSNTDVTKSDIDELVKGCVYPAYSRSGRRFIVKISPGGGLETSLLLQAKKLKESNTLEDACLPLLVDHYYHHMSSTNFFLLGFCEHGSLEKLLFDNGAVPIHKQYIAKILHGVTTAIYFLHSQNIYHGTICTANILIDHHMVGRLTGLTRTQTVSKNMNKSRQLPMYAAPESLYPNIVMELRWTVAIDLSHDIFKRAESLPQDMFAMGIDYHGVKSSITIPIDPKMWHTTQLLMSERLEMRLTAGQLLHTDWIETAATTPITQIFSWNN
ncbi:Par-1-like family member [Dirofilaria immitis]|nr:Par-1-like family member [Dirofilaria immitis]